MQIGSLESIEQRSALEAERRHRAAKAAEASNDRASSGQAAASREASPSEPQAAEFGSADVLAGGRTGRAVDTYA